MSNIYTATVSPTITYIAVGSHSMYPSTHIHIYIYIHMCVYMYIWRVSMHLVDGLVGWAGCTGLGMLVLNSVYI